MIRLWVVSLVLASGCFATPPVRGRIGWTYHPSEVKGSSDGSGTSSRTNTERHASVGVHAASAAELPFDVGAGVMSDTYRTGFYLEGAALRRVHPGWRVGATGALELWRYAETGNGFRAGITVERTGQHRTFAGADRSRCISIVGALAGVLAIGFYADAGYRWMRDEADAASFNAGLSLRWGTGAAVAYDVDCDDD